MKESRTFEDLAQAYIQDRILKGATAERLKWSKGRVAQLARVFSGRHVTDITAPALREYAHRRLAKRAAPATINRELAVLRRMFRLAAQAEQGLRCPNIPRLREAQPRQGFLEHRDYLAIRAHLTPAYQDVLDFGYYSGWRRGEILTLEWRDVDRAGCVIRLRPEVSKNRDGRVLVTTGALGDVIDRRWHSRALGDPHVFHEAARHLQGFRNAWTRACEAAGLPGKLMHDLRRTAIRNMVRAGIPERVAMTVSGHKTRSVFERYNIVSEGDLRRLRPG